MSLCADVGEAGKKLWEEVYLSHTLAASPAAHAPGVALGP